MLPETILQFGGGNFLRAFVDSFVHAANQQGQRVGRIVVVQSTQSGVAETINQCEGRYHVVTRGIRGGEKIDSAELIESLSALAAQTQWAQVRAIGASDALRYIVSNTTEAGLILERGDTQRPPPGTTPISFPAKLLDILWCRWEEKCLLPLAILPCELLPKNADRLRALVVEQAALWQAPPALVEWLLDGCVWMNSLVDRIVSGKPLEHPLLASDPLLTVAEPFAFWAVEQDERVSLFNHPALRRVADTSPYELRKVRILNGAHSALVTKAKPLGIETVRQAVEHAEVGPWLRQLLDEEIVPTIESRVPNVSAFVISTLERFANPFLEHKLSSIALNHVAKLQARLVPTRDEYIERFHRRPVLLDEILG